MGNQQYGIDSSVLSNYALEIKSIVETRCQLAIVIGGGNIYKILIQASLACIVFIC